MTATLTEMQKFFPKLFFKGPATQTYKIFPEILFSKLCPTCHNKIQGQGGRGHIGRGVSPPPVNIFYSYIVYMDSV